LAQVHKQKSSLFLVVISSFKYSMKFLPVLLVLLVAPAWCLRIQKSGSFPWKTLHLKETLHLKDRILSNIRGGTGSGLISYGLCAHKGGFFANMFLEPLTMKYVLSHGEVCDAHFMHDILIALSESANNTDLEQCGRQEDGNCRWCEELRPCSSELCGCFCKSSCGMCPCRTYRLLYLSSVLGTILNRHELPFFFKSGVLVGALRYGGLMPHDYDADWGVYVENEASLERLWKAIDEINDYLQQGSGLLSGDVGYGNRSWDSMQADGVDMSMFWIVLPQRGNIEVDHIDLAIIVPNQTNPEELLFLQDGQNHKVSKADVFPLIQCEFHGGAWPCPRRSQVLLAQTYPNSSARNRDGDPSDDEHVSESLHCLDSSGRPSLSVCAKMGKINKDCTEFPAKAVHEYVPGSMPTPDLAHLVGLFL